METVAFVVIIDNSYLPKRIPKCILPFHQPPNTSGSDLMNLPFPFWYRQSGFLSSQPLHLCLQPPLREIGIESLVHLKLIIKLAEGIYVVRNNFFRVINTERLQCFPLRPQSAWAANVARISSPPRRPFRLARTTIFLSVSCNLTSP